MDHPGLYAVLKQLPGLLGHYRRAEIIALSLAALVALKEFELRSGFYSFRNYPLF